MPLCALEVKWLDAENRLWTDDLRVWEAREGKKNEELMLFLNEDHRMEGVFTEIPIVFSVFPRSGGYDS